jgi:hypothetical protein
MLVGANQDLLMKGASLPQIMVKGGRVKTDTVMCDALHRQGETIGHHLKPFGY